MFVVASYTMTDLPTLSTDAEHDWRAFVENVNWDHPHPADWQRFYRFIIGVHRRKDAPSDSTVGELLKAATDNRSARSAFYTVYTAGTELLPEYDAMLRGNRKPVYDRFVDPSERGTARGAHPEQ